jgi:signal transduction histidine kinase
VPTPPAAAGQLTSSVNDRILRIVLRNLVDNACVHNDADEPLVVVSADTEESGGIAIAIADYGPGLAAHEREPLNAGREQPLDHGSGLGLWTAQWGITRLGGDLSFSDNVPRGTIVRLDLPGVQSAASGRS